MKVLLVGFDRPGALERSYARALSGLGADVRIFDWFGAGAIPLVRALNRRPAWPLIARRANARLLAHGRGGGFDAIVIFKGLLVDRETVEELRAPGTRVLCLNPDNPWNPSPSTYSETAQRAMPAWDAYLIWSESLVDRLYCAGCRRVEVFPFAWDPQAHPHLPVGPDEESADIAFIGRWSRHREMWLAHLSDHRVTLFGSDWAAAAERIGAREFRVESRAPYDDEYARETRGARVALNILNPHNCPGSNMRSFEIPGAGGVTCSTHTADLAHYFPAGAISTFRTPDDLRTAVDGLLSDPGRRTEIRERSHEIAKGHTYGARAGQLLALIEELQRTGPK
jgi:hypothetical protein